MKRIFLQKKQNKTILELLREQGEYLDAPCSGKGTCGKCCIIIEETRKTDPPKQREKEVFTERELEEGWRLSCMTVPTDDHYYQEKFYFTPGDTGFKVFDTKYGCIGIGICWDQWFPETARAMALLGAELLFYPTAIGSEPILECDSMPHWRRCMQGHAAANLMPVIAANRIGREVVQPCAENGGQESALEFYGSSFLTDETGEVILSASRDKEEILSQTYELDELRAKRLEWGLFRDRRPEYYGIIAGEKNGR